MANTSPTLAQLLAALEGAGRPGEVLTGADGTRILVLPHGGRILGLFPPGSEDNLLWTNPALATPATATALFTGADWCNSGGDRTWLAPEASFFLPKFPDTSVYFQPRQLDPGAYRCTRSGDGAHLVNDLTIESARTREQLALRIAKTVTPAPGPLADAELSGIVSAGYNLHSSLELLRGPSRSSVGLWQLLQLPHGGQMLIPTYSRGAARVFFGQVPNGHLVAEERAVRYTMNSPGEHKIGVKAAALTGRAGYVYGAGPERVLVVRNFFVNPAGAYVDVPWTDEADVGYAFQACNVSNAALGSFSELEYHVPAIGGRTGLTECADVSQVWAFRGPGERVEHLARLLLGAA